MITFGQATNIDYRPYADSGAGGGISTALVWAKIYRRKWLIAALSILLFGLFSAVLVLLPSWYTTETEIVIEQRPQGVDLAAILSRLPTDSQAILTEAEALRSRELVQRTIRELGLLTNPEFNPRIIPHDGSLRSRWRETKASGMAYIGSFLPERPKASGDAVLNDATEIFLKHLRVTMVGRSQVLKATFTSESPELASEILNTLVRFYLSAQMDNRVAVPTKIGDFLKSELATLQAKVRDSNEAVERYRNQARLQQGIVQGRETLLSTQELSEANSELITVRSKRREAEARLSEIRANTNSFPDVLASVPIQQLRQQLSTLKESRSQLIANYGSSYPKLQQVEASIAEGEQRQKVEIGKIVQSIASDTVVLAAREAQLVQTVASAKEQIQSSGDARVNLASLEQEAEVNRTMLSTFLTQYNQLSSQRTLKIADSYVLASADIPTTPSFPPSIPFLGLAAVISVVLSACCALLLERTGETIRGSHEVPLLLAARSLGAIPKLRPGNAPFTQVIDRPQSPFTEAIWNVLSRFMPTHGGGRAVLVASAQFGEGRTSVAVALARLAALSGKRTILIDCDLRRPGLHDAFGATMGPGLTDVLQDRLEPGKAVRKDTLTPLDYIASGQLAPHVANLLCLARMERLVAKLRGEYDLVILDSPPSAVVADARVLAQLADEFLFVVNWNKTSWRLVRQQMQELSQHDCSLTGVVLNQVDMRRHSKYELTSIEPRFVPAMIGTEG